MTEDLWDPHKLIHLVLRLGGLIPELLTRGSAPDLTAQRPRDSQPSYKMTQSTSTLLPPNDGCSLRNKMSFPGDSDGEKSACSARNPGSIPGSGRSPGGENGKTHSSILAWRIPWTEEPGRLQSMGLQRIGRD